MSVRMCVYVCVCVCMRGGVFMWESVRVYVFVPMFVLFRMCVSACVCLPFVSFCACVLVGLRVCARVC